MGRSITSRSGPLPAPSVFISETTLTRFSGLVPVIRYLVEKLDIVTALFKIAPPDGKRRVFARHLVLFSFLVCSLAGVHRLAHIERLAGDAVLEKFLRLPRWPVRKVFSSALNGVTDRGIKALSDLIASIGLSPLVGKCRAVIDLDSSAIVTFGNQQGARFGYSGKGRNRRRHHPLVASVAEHRAVVLADYRDGSAIDAEEAKDFAQRALKVLRKFLCDGATVYLRADSGFWSKKFGAWLLDNSVPFVCTLPLQPKVKRTLIGTRWRGLDGDPDIQVAIVAGPRLGLDERLRVIGIRRRVLDPKEPPQGKKIDGCAGWRYQALVTVLDWAGEDVWRFYNGRADSERVFKVARNALGMGRLIGHSLRANETAFLLRLLAYNADLRFALAAEEAVESPPSQVAGLGLVARQRRFYQGAGRLVRCQGQWVLRVVDQFRVRQLWALYAPELLQAE